MPKPKILYSTTYTEIGYDFLRQVPSCDVDWNPFSFTTDASDPEIVACAVYDDVPEQISLPIARSNTLLITGEPPSLRTYRPRFTYQFGSVRTSHSQLKHPNRVLDHEGQPWYYGLFESQTHGSAINYDFLKRLCKPSKKRKLSVIASNKTTTPDHRARLRFVENLKDAFPDQIDVFGRGIRSVDDKADAILPYEYHIVLENDHSDYYVSEKLTDAYLGWAFPFYSGSSRIQAIMPSGSYAIVDMYQPERSVETIRKMMEDEVAVKNEIAFTEARNMVLNEMNQFAIIARHFTPLLNAGELTRSSDRQCVIYPKREAVKQTLSQALRWARISS